MPKGNGLTIGIDASRTGVDQETGTERYSRRIIEAILHAGAEHDFRLYLNRRQPLSLPVRANTIQRTIPFARLWTHLRLSMEIIMHPVDALFVPAHVIPPVHPRASVVTIHDLGYLHEPESHRGAARRYLDLSTRWSCHQASHIIAVSNATRDDLIREYGVSASKISVIYHGIDDTFRPASPQALACLRDRLNLPERYILYLGTLQPRKNLVRLIQAFDMLADADPTQHLVLAGKRGWLFEEIERAVAKSRHRHRIMLPGHVHEQYLPALYTGASVLVLPSLSEGFGLPALEAMACGAPVVVSNRGALPEVVGDGAIVVEPESVEAIAVGIRKALEPATREQRRAQGQFRASQFRWDTAGRRTLRVLESAFAQSRT